MNRRRTTLMAVMLALAGASGAFAAAGGANDGDAGIDFNKQLTLSPKETLAQSRSYYAQMLETRKHVQLLQVKAKKDKDMVKLNCVNDKLTQLNGHLILADKALASLNADIASGDDAARQHEFTRISIVYQKTVTLGTEAEQCVGEDVSYVGATSVEVEIDPSIPPTDPTEPSLPVPVVTRPPEASPFV